MNALYQKYIANINFNQFTKWCFTLWFYSFILKMDKRKNMMTPFWVKKTGGKNVIFVDANCKGNHLKKSIKKYNFKKDLMNLIETNNQIRMLSDHSVSSNNSFKSLWMLAVVQLQLCESWLNLTQGLLQGWRKRTKVMWIRLQEKTEKNSYYQLFQQKHNLMVIVMEKLLM